MSEIQDSPNSYREYPGPILLLAGPGTGKTYQLAMRVKYLIKELEVRPDEITIITFTNEAARNMRERLTKKDIDIPKEDHPEIISTMHSLGNSIIGSIPKKFGLKEDYKVLNEKHPRVVLMQDAAYLAGNERNDYKKIDDYRRKGVCKVDKNNDKCNICVEYIKILRKCSLVDYDDQIYLACKALKTDKKLREEWKRKTKYLLVDEYQDINQAQCEFIQILSEGQEEGLFVVGDDDQSIYSFRGGNPDYVREFEQYFGAKSKIGRLSKSWRCPENILKGARAMLLKYYSDSVPKPEPTFNEKIKENNKIVFIDVPSFQKEAKIISAIAREKIRTNSVTIIIPNGNYLPPIKGALQYAGLDYKYKIALDDEGLLRFTLIGDWVSDQNNNLVFRHLLDLIINNHDELTKRVECQSRKINDKRDLASKIIAGLWKEVTHSKSLLDVFLEKAERAPKDSYLKELKKTLDSLYNLIIEKGGRRSGLPEFLKQSGLFVAPCKNANGLIAEVIEWKNEIIGGSKGKSFDPISIYNMPSSKGLEGDVIIVVGLSEGLFPDQKRDIEEQSRLFYVAMTRAKKELYIFSSRTRPANITFQKKSFQFRKSPFIDAIPNDYLEKKYIKAS